MQALLHMIDNEDDLRCAIALCSAKGVTIVHRECAQELDEEIIERCWFLNNGCWILRLGATFGDRWELISSPERQGKVFTGLCVHFVGTSWDVPREFQEEQAVEAGMPGDIAVLEFLG